MSEDKEPMNPTLARLTKGTMMATGQALMLHYPVAGMLITGAAELAGPGPGGLGAALQRFQESKFIKTALSLWPRIEKEGIASDPEQIDYLFEKAVPFVTNASTERKRQVMEEVILNGIRRAHNEAAQIETGVALETISQMPDEALLLFATIIQDMTSKSRDFIEKSNLDPGLKDFLLKDAYSYLKGHYEHTPIGNIGMVFPREIRPALITEEIEFDGFGGQRPTGIYRLSPHGQWLAGWINNNPLDGEPNEGNNCS